MSPNFKDLLHEFSDHAVEFLLVGAHALAAHGHTRATKDIDLWVRPTDTNARQVIAALVSFGAPLQGLTPEDLTVLGTVFQIGVDPERYRHLDDGRRPGIRRSLERPHTSGNGRT